MSKNDMVVVPRELAERILKYIGREGAEELIEVLEQPVDQHQGEPVALPERQSEDCFQNDQSEQAVGWNSCLDEIAKLGPLFRHPAQGEPYGWAHDDGKEFTTHADHASDLQREGIQMLPLYTHADPGDVEKANKLAETSADQVVKLLAQLRDANDKLAERDALLRGLDDAWNSHDGKEPFGKLMQQVEELLASAEPSAPVEIDERAEIKLDQVLRAYEYAEGHPHRYLRGTTNWCAAVAHSLNEQSRDALTHKP